MTAEDVAIGVIVRLTPDARARRLWAAQSDNTAVIRGTLQGTGVVYVRVTVDGERTSRLRTMRPDLLEVVN